MLKSLDYKKISKSTPGHVPRLNLSNVASSDKKNRIPTRTMSGMKRGGASVSISPRIDKERIKLFTRKTPRAEIIDDSSIDTELSSLQSQLSVSNEANKKLVDELTTTKATNEFLTDKVRQLETYHSQAKSEWAEERIMMQQLIIKLQKSTSEPSDASQPNYKCGLMG